MGRVRSRGIFMGAKGKRKRVLSVDDDEANQYLMQLVLEKGDCDIELAANGQEAVAKVEAGKFDVIFMDLRMPVMDGFEATEQIRKKLDKKVMIVAVTAHTVSETIDKCMDAGMNGFIPKAGDIEKLETDILAWVAKS